MRGFLLVIIFTLFAVSGTVYHNYNGEKVMDVHEMIQYTKEYLYKSKFQAEPIGEYRLNGKLQYLLCGAFERLTKEFGEITRHDIAHLVEA